MSQDSAASAADFADLLDRDRLVDRLRQLVQIPSENPPGNEEPAAHAVAAICRELDLEVELVAADPHRPSVLARRSGDGATLCFCSHLDVVPAGDRASWVRDPYGGVVEEGRLYGRGACDAKGPVAAALEAVELLRAADVELSGTLELAFCCDEEAMGFKGAGDLVARDLLRPDMAIVGEPTSLRVVRAQRGASWYRLRTRGAAAHGSQPERGVNAIMHLAAISLELERHLPDVEHPLLGRPSINLGTISGGDKVNMVPSWCEAQIDRRTIPGESPATVRESIEAAVEAARARFPGIDASLALEFEAAPFEVPETSRVVQEAVSAMAAALEAPATIVGFRGASDARFLADAGADVVVCGPGDISVAHTVDEFVDLDELAAAAVGYAVCFRRLLS